MNLEWIFSEVDAWTEFAVKIMNKWEFKFQEEMLNTCTMGGWKYLFQPNYIKMIFLLIFLHIQTVTSTFSLYLSTQVNFQEILSQFYGQNPSFLSYITNL